MELNQILNLYKSQGSSHPERVQQLALWAFSEYIWLFSNAYRHYYHKLKYDVPTSPYHKIHIRPVDVKYIAKTGYSISKQKGTGRIVDGNWDHSRIRWEDHKVYQGLRERYVIGLAWEDTKYVEKAKKAFEEGRSRQGYNTLEEFIEKRCSYVDELYSDIQRNGYQADAQSANFPEGDLRNKDHTHARPPLICIGRNGEFLLRDGRHRIALADILDVERVPVLVLARHKNWQQVREACYNCDRYDQLPELAKRKPDHPDLVSVPSKEQ